MRLSVLCGGSSLERQDAIIRGEGGSMRIAVSGMFWRQPRVGSGQYLRGLLDGLPRTAPEHEYFVLLPALFEHRSAAWSDVGRRSSVVIRTPFDARSNNLAKLWFEQIGAPLA